MRWDATGVDIVRGLTMLRMGTNARISTLESKAELVDALDDLFGLDAHACGEAALDEMWARTHRNHEAWEAAGRP
jgi:hypothetical protein